MYINGQWLKEDRNELIVKNPATGEIVDKVFQVNKQDVQLAIDSAQSAFKIWSKLTVDVRSEYLQKIANKLEEKHEEISRVITEEMGKSLAGARYEVTNTIKYFNWYAEEAKRVYGQTVLPSANNKRYTVTKEPIGVSIAITAWNFPIFAIARKIAPALAVGCTVLVKPSSAAPLAAKKLFEIFEDVNLPKGVANLLVGSSNEITEIIMNSKEVKKISFTGSTEVGKLLAKESAQTLKRVSLELGGHAPFIVFKDADFDLAIDSLLKNKFASNGQQCVGANRIYVEQTIYEKFSQKLNEKVLELKVGNCLNEENTVGPLINEKAVSFVQSQVDDAVKHGAEVLAGGERLSEGDYSLGSYYPPTVLKNVDESMIITKEETFGPVIPLIPFDTEEEVLFKANDSEYGLAAYFYTNDVSRIYRMYENLEYGIIGVNDFAPFSVQIPFGGVKESGYGREGGAQGVEEYLQVKLVSIQIENKIK